MTPGVIYYKKAKSWYDFAAHDLFNQLNKVTSAFFFFNNTNHYLSKRNRKNIDRDKKNPQY